MPRPTGRPRKYAAGLDGKPVPGLHLDIATNRYYRAVGKQKIYLGRDLSAAIAALRAHESAEQTITMPVLQPLIPAVIQDESVAEGWITAEAAKKPVPVPEQVPLAGFLQTVRDMIVSRPDWTAERLGIPELARLSSLPAAEKPLTLKRAGDLYFQKRKKTTPDWARKQRLFWEEFVQVVGVKTVREVTPKVIESYHRGVWSAYEHEGRSPTYVSHRTQAVRTILRNAMKHAPESREQLRRVLDATQIFELPSKSPVMPRPISREDFARLLEVADVKWRAALLLSLNCLLYGVELSRVLKSEIDLQRRTFIAVRQKTHTARVAMLWGRTVDAARDYLAQQPHGLGHLFVTREGGPYGIEAVRRHFAKLREKAGLSSDVQFNMIRDGGYTAAAQGGAVLDEIRMLAGQRAGGTSDNYLLRSPNLVSKACEAIERFYFEADDVDRGGGELPAPK